MKFFALTALLAAAQAIVSDEPHVDVEDKDYWPMHAEMGDEADWDMVARMNDEYMFIKSDREQGTVHWDLTAWRDSGSNVWTLKAEQENNDIIISIVQGPSGWEASISKESETLNYSVIIRDERWFLHAWEMGANWNAEGDIKPVAEGLPAQIGSYSNWRAYASIDGEGSTVIGVQDGEDLHEITVNED